jgi:outer membrane biosynthesis protein TonB
MPAPTKPKPAPKKTAAPATPAVAKKAAPKEEPQPKAGGGPTGGAGTDVANIKTEGVEFTDQAYLNNIVRQIAVRFNPRNPGALRAEVFFIVRRDGSIGEFRFLNKSGVYAFDLEAQGAVEAAGSAKAFGALPSSYVNDFLPVIFSFDPSLIR